MAIYNFKNNHLEKVTPTTFSNENIYERKNLQAALKQNIDIVAPECLVIAEEFSEWLDSNRRIDLLAVDKDANLVVIELKRTESGEHMDLQSIRYAAMVSTLKFKEATDIFQKYLDKNEIADDAEEKLLEFLEWDTPQEENFALDVSIVLVSADFSKELTSSVMWLSDRYINIKCIRLKPYNYQDNVLIDVQQIIPLPEAESYRVKIKEQAEERREARKSTRDNSHYLFNGDTYNKRKLVLAVLQNWFAENNPKELDEFLKVFPNELHTGGLFVELSKAQEVSERQGINRYFIDNEELFNFPDGSIYAASNQWGKRNIDQFINQAKEHGFEIEQIPGTSRRSQSEDIGEVVENIAITLNDGVKYNIVRRDSGQIKVFINGKKINAAGFFRKAIEELGFEIPIEGNSQTLGKRFLDKLRGINE